MNRIKKNWPFIILTAVFCAAAAWIITQQTRVKPFQESVHPVSMAGALVSLDDSLVKEYIATVGSNDLLSQSALLAANSCNETLTDTDLQWLTKDIVIKKEAPGEVYLSVTYETEAMASADLKNILDLGTAKFLTAHPELSKENISILIYHVEERQASRMEPPRPKRNAALAGLLGCLLGAFVVGPFFRSVKAKRANCYQEPVDPNEPVYHAEILKKDGIPFYDSRVLISPMRDEFVSMWENKYILRRMIFSNFKTRYKRSYLGMIWSMLNPLLNMLVMYVVFSYLFRFQIEHYPIYLFCGNILFAFFSQSTSEAMNQMIGNQALISKIYLPKSIYVFSGIGINLINLILSFVPLFLLSLVDRLHFTPYIALSIPLMVILLIFTLGMSLIVATIVPFLNDFNQIWGVLLTLWNFLSAIFYPVSVLPPRLMSLMNFNPLYVYITIFRDVFVYGNASSGSMWIIGTTYAIIFFIAGWWLFSKNSNEFSYRG